MRLYLNLTPVNDNATSSIYINVDAIQAIEECGGGSLVRIEGVAYEVEETPRSIIDMIKAVNTTEPYLLGVDLSQGDDFCYFAK